MHRFRRMQSLQKFASVYNQDRSLSKRGHFKLNRTAALAETRSNSADSTIVPQFGPMPTQPQL